MRRAERGWVTAGGGLALASLALAVGLLAASPARADLDPTKPDEKAPDAAGHGDAPVPHQNPLPGIIDLMREVEDALAEADTEGWTQREQERIVEALKGQQDTVKLLEKLIEEIESQAQQQGGGGGGQSSGKASGSKGQRKPGGKRKSGNRSKSTDPQKSGQNGQEKKSKQQAQNDRRSQAKKRQDAAAAAAAAKRAKAGDGWGNLPMKAAREVLESTARKKPLSYREQLDRYFKRLTKGRR